MTAKLCSLIMTVHGLCTINNYVLLLHLPVINCWIPILSTCSFVLYQHPVHNWSGFTCRYHYLYMHWTGNLIGNINGWVCNESSLHTQQVISSQTQTVGSASPLYMGDTYHITVPNISSTQLNTDILHFGHYTETSYNIVVAGIRDERQLPIIWW